MTLIEPIQDEQEFNWKQQRFQEWLALPRDKRPPNFQTQQQVAEALAVHPHTLTMWKRQPGFWDVVYEDARAIVGGELPQIISAMVEKAEQGSVSAAKLCLQVLEVLKEETTHRIEYVEPLTVILDAPKYSSQRPSESLPGPTHNNSLPDDDVVDGEVRDLPQHPHEAKPSTPVIENIRGLEIVYADEEQPPGA
jgi:hypothetical protein